LKRRGAKNFYEGEWKGGNISGHGALHFANGETCEGDWKENRLIDKGTATRNGKAVSCEIKRGKIVYSKLETKID